MSGPGPPATSGTYAPAITVCAGAVLALPPGAEVVGGDGFCPVGAMAVDHHIFSTQYHPEFKSRPFKPSPPFYGLLLAASGQALLPHHSWSTVAPPETRTLIQGGAAGKPTWLMDES